MRCHPILLGTTLMLAVLGCRDSSAPDPEAARTAIRTLLQAQVTAWNRGDLNAFMGGYARTDSLRFASGGTVRHGWDTARARYRAAYPNRAAMGTLAFEQLAIRVLSPRYAQVFGQWRLQRADDAAHGVVTLIVERRPEGWRIIHDHTSSAP